MTRLAMFPLGTVLLPSAFLPLQVFEPRYQALVRDCLDGDREFGVVLIERGSEVGGGDTRTAVGTVARIVEASELGDGRWMLATVGTRRIRVTDWLADDPYPMAEVDDWLEPEAPESLAGEMEAVLGVLRRVLARCAELGEQRAPATIELAEDPVLASYQAAAVAPIGPADQQRLLAAPTATDRVAMLADLLAEEDAVLVQRLALGDGEPDG